jgi:hypothetical protein
MSHRSAPIALALLGLALIVGAADAQKDKAKDTEIKPDREWVGSATDNNLAKEAPKDGIITEAKTFEKLWKAWRKDEKAPSIDFSKRLVVVTLSTGGPNKPKTRALLSPDGNLKIMATAARKGGAGFGYALGVYRKKEVKKVNGKDVAGKE